VRGQDLQAMDAKVEAERRMHEIAGTGRQEQEALDVYRHNRNLQFIQS
jgi:hypothetical protein